MKKASILLILMVLLSVFANAQQTETAAGVTPDSFIWGLDKALDQIGLLLTFDKGEKAKKGLEIARERLFEVKQMIEENKLEAAEKAKEEHGKTLLKVKQRVLEIEDGNSSEEIKKIVEIEKELENYDEDVDETFGELKIKIKIEGEITPEQKELVESILNSLKNQTGEVEIEIKNKKNNIKIKIREETGKSEEEIESEIEEIEKEEGFDKQENALDAINDIKKEFSKFLQKAEENNVIVSENLTEEFNTLLQQAESQYADGEFAAARETAKQAEKLMDEESDEDDEREIEIEVEDGEAKVKVKIGNENLKFRMESTDLDEIISEISKRTGLTKEEINAIAKIEEESNDEDSEKEGDSDQEKSNEASQNKED
ncbi:MAG: DUF5667 domain-containing protein, partial [Nanoarchaeota archaeon]